jgi:hypothetical protein
MTAVATAQRKPRLTLPSNILDAMSSEQWWGPWFSKGDWSAWRSFLPAAFGLPMNADQLAIYQQCTGSATAPTQQCAEAWAIAGRRGGKSRIMSLCAAWLAGFVDWRDYLAPGEVATCHVLAANRKQARVVFRYIRSLFNDHHVLARLVARETEDTLELTNKVVIEVQTANYRVVRGYSICAVIADELAFWLSDEDAANPAAEIIDGLRPAMATMPNAMLMVATSPYARKGPVWDAWRKHYKQEHDPVLVWQAPTRRSKAHSWPIMRALSSNSTRRLFSNGSASPPAATLAKSSWRPGGWSMLSRPPRAVRRPGASGRAAG